MSEDFGGSWTSSKLLILGKYVQAFNIASQRAPSTVYLDLFAGNLKNRLPTTSEEYEGSTGVALRADPPFDRLVFWELDKQAERLRAELVEAFPGDQRYAVIAGDCNTSISDGLRNVSAHRRAPTFAFIDPKGLDVAWTTLKTLASWRQDPKRRKVELWILLPDPAISRVLGLRGNRGRGVQAKLNTMYGCRDWEAIYRLRNIGAFTAAQARAEYVNLYRWRIEHELGYGWTHALQLENDSGSPVYTMIYATDDKTGNKIMQDVYNTALVREIPELRSRSIAARTAHLESSAGVQHLFEADAPVIQASSYEYVQTWTPPPPLKVSLEFKDDPTVDAELE